MHFSEPREQRGLHPIRPDRGRYQGSYIPEIIFYPVLLDELPDVLDILLLKRFELQRFFFPKGFQVGFEVQIASCAAMASVSPSGAARRLPGFEDEDGGVGLGLQQFPGDAGACDAGSDDHVLGGAGQRGGGAVICER